MLCAFMPLANTVEKQNKTLIVAGNGGIGEGDSAFSIDAAARLGVVSGDRHIPDGHPALRINAATIADTRTARSVIGNFSAGDGDP